MRRRSCSHWPGCKTENENEPKATIRDNIQQIAFKKHTTLPGGVSKRSRSSLAISVSVVREGICQKVAHVDGGHSYETALSDLLLCAEHMVPGGVIAVDDYENYAWPEVTPAVATADSPQCTFPARCTSTLRARSKQRSIGARMMVTSSIVTTNSDGGGRIPPPLPLEIQTKATASSRQPPAD